MSCGCVVDAGGGAAVVGDVTASVSGTAVVVPPPPPLLVENVGNSHMEENVKTNNLVYCMEI